MAFDRVDKANRDMIASANRKRKVPAQATGGEYGLNQAFSPSTVGAYAQIKAQELTNQARNQALQAEQQRQQQYITQLNSAYKNSMNDARNTGANVGTLANTGYNQIAQNMAGTQGVGMPGISGGVASRFMGNTANNALAKSQNQARLDSQYNAINQSLSDAQERAKINAQGTTMLSDFMKGSYGVLNPELQAANQSQQSLYNAGDALRAMGLIGGAYQAQQQADQMARIRTQQQNRQIQLDNQRYAQQEAERQRLLEQQKQKQQQQQNQQAKQDSDFIKRWGKYNPNTGKFELPTNKSSPNKLSDNFSMTFGKTYY